MSDTPTRPSRLASRSAALRSLPGRLPLRVILVVALVVLSAVGLIASAVLVTSSLQTSLISRIDDSLHDAAVGWARPRQGLSETSGTRRPGPELPPSEFFVRIRATDGVFQTPNTLIDDPPLIPDDLAQGVPVTVNSESGQHHWRILSTDTVLDGQPANSVVGLPLDDTEAVVDRLIVLQVVVGVVVLAFLAGVAYLAVRRSLRRLVQVEHIAAAIADGDMSRRVPTWDERTEVGRLSAALNVMLARIQQAFADTAASEATARSSEDRMRRFVADASHELRTPLTTIRGFTELYRQGADDDVDRILDRIEGESRRMGVLVEDLLMLARLDAQRPIERVPVDLLRIAGDAVHEARARAPQRTVGLEVFGDRPAVVLGDDARLRQVMANLVSNALRHTPASASITVRVGVTDEAVGSSTAGGAAVLEVVDTGPGMPPEQAERVFERFYRADGSRSRGSGGGAGLGLSIVHAIVAAHGGRVELYTAPEQGSRFVVLLPGIALPGGDDPDDEDPED